MTIKYNFIVENINKAVNINNDQINYNANIIVDLEKDIDFYYAIIDEGSEDNPSIHFTQAKKFALIRHTNTNGIYKQKKLLLKSHDKSPANITVDIENLYKSDDILEKIQRGTVLLNATDGTSNGATTSGTSNTTTTPATTTPANNNNNKKDEEKWYKDPIKIAIIVVILLIIYMLFMKNRKENSSIFID